MKIRFTAQEKGQRVILEEFEGQVLFQTDRVVTVYVPKSIAEKLRDFIEGGMSDDEKPR